MRRQDGGGPGACPGARQDAQSQLSCGKPAVELIGPGGVLAGRQDGRNPSSQAKNRLYPGGILAKIGRAAKRAARIVGARKLAYRLKNRRQIRRPGGFQPLEKDTPPGQTLLPYAAGLDAPAAGRVVDGFSNRLTPGRTPDDFFN